MHRYQNGNRRLISFISSKTPRLFCHHFGIEIIYSVEAHKEYAKEKPD